MRTRRSLSLLPLVFLFATACVQPQRGPVKVSPSTSGQSAVHTPATALPNRPDSLKFAVLGDFGDGSSGQLQMASEMARVRERFPYEHVITVGDNIYGGQGPGDLLRKFETPYKPLLDAGVKFYASLGNHDSPDQRYYKLFNMGGQRYYSFQPAAHNVRFFALESSYLIPEQLAWLEKALEDSREDWKIAYFHHPPYSSGGRHGSHPQQRKALEPLFVKHNVSVVFTGHDHIYERVKPQQGIVYFVAGSGGKLRRGNIDRSTGFSAASDATDQAFLACEINGDELFFNAISRTGRVIDSGTITRRK